MSNALRSLLPLAAGLFFACKPLDKPDKGDGITPSSSTAPADAPSDIHLTADLLSPIIRPVGTMDALPEKVVVEFSVPCVEQDKVDAEVSENTVLTLSPEVDGTLSFTGLSTLVFTPEDGFKPDTEYKVTLGAVDTREGVLKPEGEAGWTWTFKTPPFKLLHASPVSMDFNSKRVEVDLVFAGAVDNDDVEDAATWSVNGKVIQPRSTYNQDSRNIVRVTLVDDALGKNARLVVKVDKGIPYDGPGKARAPAFEDTLVLNLDKAITIRAAKRKEGPTGHYVDVVCNDSAAGESTRYFYDRDDWTWYDDLSPRCLLTDESARETIHFDPPVNFYVTSSEGGFRIVGDFKRGSYSMRIDDTAVSADGGRLAGTWSSSFTVPARSPRVSFVSSGRYLPRTSWKNLAITHVNVPAAEVEVRQIRPENMVFWLSGPNERVDERVSDLVLKTRLNLRGNPDTETTSWVDLSALLPDKAQGVFEIGLKAPGTESFSRLLLTDLNLVAKRSARVPDEPWSREIRVWALDMHANKPQSGVEMRLVRPSGKVLAHCATGMDGGCILQVPVDDVDPTAPIAILAQSGEDFTYLRFSDLQTDLSEAQVQGESYLTDVPYRAASWSDRGVYRPGETAHFAALVRTSEGVAAPKDMPVKVKLMDPLGIVARERVVKVNEAGLLAEDFGFEAFARTGRYQVVLEAGDKPLGQYDFNVEEFVPERMKVTVGSSVAGVAQPEDAPLDVEARYLFGGSAAGSQVELTCQVEPTTFKPKNNAQYSYGVWRGSRDAAKAITLGAVSGALDDDGKATLRCPSLGGKSVFAGPASLTADAAVFEAGSGRTTRGAVAVPLHPEKYYVGLQSGARKAEEGKTFTVEGIVVDWDGNPVPSVTSVDIDLVRLEAEYTWWWDDEDGDERFERMLRPMSEGRQTVQVSNGRFSLPVTPTSPSDGFLVRARAGNARTDLQLEGGSRSYWWGPSESRVDQTPKPLKPTSVEVTLPPSVRVGDKAVVKFTSPYKGRALLTVETHKVLQSDWMDVDAGEQTWSFKLSEFAPNVYVSAFIAKDPYLDSKSAFLPDRAFGVASVKVEPTAYTQKVKLDVPPEVRSMSPLQVKLDLGPVPPGTFATVAAVDEGILSLTRFESPDPLSSIFARRALGVDSFETLGWSVLLPPMNGASTGGDEGGGGAGRVQPVKPVALWSGVVSVPESGKVTVDFAVPQYRGALRVMAVTADPKRMGSASATVLVRDPLVLQTTLPRFLVQGDRAQIPVFVTNMSGQDQKVEIGLTAEPLPVPGLDPARAPVAPIRFLGERVATVPLKDGASTTVVFQVQGEAAVGAAKVKVTARAGSIVSYEELDVPFNPPGTRVRKLQKVELAGGMVDLLPYLSGWTPTTEETTFWVTNNPYGEAFDHLKHLVRYPHGCIEQTTSTARPLLYVGNLLYNVDPKLVAESSIEKMVEGGIRRILSMQTSQGGFAYWPGGTEPNYWGTAYATHFLIDAKRKGYDVPQERLDDAVDFIDDELSKKADRNDTAHGYAFQYGEAYLHYVLALSDKGRAARIQELIDEKASQKDAELSEQVYLLKAALYLTGDRRYEKDLKNPDVSPLNKRDRRNNYAFYSDLRRRGLQLSVFEDVFKNDPMGEPLVRLVADGLQQERSSYYTTQELVWGITGLGRWIEAAAKEIPAPTLAVDGASVKPQPQPPSGRAADRTWSVARASEAQSLTLNLDGTPGGKLYLLMSTVGVRTDEPPRYGGEGLSITRSYVNLAGDPLNTAGGDLTLGDMVYVKVRLTNTRSADIPNLALVDRLPAGWEIENPRLGRGALPEWADADAAWDADYMNVRDDRVEVFGTLPANQSREVVYAVRAVTAGTFVGPAVEAEAMYDPDIWARAPGGTVVIAGPWADFLL